jgi:hypothetical protein
MKGPPGSTSPKANGRKPTAEVCISASPLRSRTPSVTRQGRYNMSCMLPGPQARRQFHDTASHHRRQFDRQLPGASRVNEDAFREPPKPRSAPRIWSTDFFTARRHQRGQMTRRSPGGKAMDLSLKIITSSPQTARRSASALTRTEDSQRRRAVRVCWNGSDRLASPLGST